MARRRVLQGGAGRGDALLYQGATFFGILFGGRLYLKTARATEPAFLVRGMKPFRAGDRHVLRTYYEVHADVLEDREDLTGWALAAAQCAALGAGGCQVIRR